MTTPYEDFVNIALGKALSSDVTLPTANEIPVFTGIGRQVTGKTKAELGLALTADLDTDGTLAANSDTKYPSQKAVKTYADTKQAALVSGTNIKTVNGSSLLGSGDLITATIPEVKSASFTAVTGKAYTLGSPGSTLNIQFPVGTTDGEEIIIHVNRSAQTQTVYTVPPAGQHVAYVGAGSYQLVSGFCDHILRFEFVLSTQLWELKGIVPAGSIIDVMAFRSSTNVLSSLKFNLPTADGAYQWYTPAKNINFGELANVATTDGNNLSGTRNRIVGGSYNTVSGTDNIAIGCSYVTLDGIGQIVLGATTLTRLKCNGITVLGAAQASCTNIKHFLYKGSTASCYLSNAAGQANAATPDTTNCPRATLASTAGVSLFELRFVSDGYDTTPAFVGSISGCRVFSVHSDGVGGYTVSAVATPYADMATGGLGISFAITVITAGGGEKLLQIIPTVSGLGGGASNNYATLDALHQW